jgi:uncharacterized FlaG/YvyC family protein
MSVKINPDHSVDTFLRRSVVKRERVKVPAEKVTAVPTESAGKVLAERIEQAVRTRREKSSEAVKESIAELKDAFSIFNVAIKFDTEEALNNQLVVRLVKKDSGEVVYQIPPEYVLELRRMAELFPGLYLDRSA